jgi:Fe-S cluster biosynthesis and repair protein YggX
MTNIYRFKFTDEFTNELSVFSKIHQYDERKVFKEAWNTWVEENTELVDTEVRRLTNLNYDGDVLEKMFKSARYYFRKKSAEKKEPQQRRTYIGVQKELLDAMDAYISKNIVDKPSDGFEDFCKSNQTVIHDEINNLIQNDVTDVDEIHDKIKKTFKNRYFMLISK